MAGYALVVDSDPSRASLYGELAAAEGLEPHLASDGAQAGEVLRQRGAPALLIADLALPRTDGFALLRELRRTVPPEESPAVVVSAFPELRGAAETLRGHLGIKAILPRTATVELLHRAIKRALRGLTTLDLDPAGTAVEAARRETARLESIAAMGLVDNAPPEEVLQALVKDTAEAFKVPVALVSLVLEERQWFKAYFGLGADLVAERGTPRDWSFCRHVVEGREPLVVPDAATHPFFSANPLVKAGVLGSYAGAPLITAQGDVLGSLCIIDSRPLGIGAREVEALVRRARRVTGELELRGASWRRRMSVAPPGTFVFFPGGRPQSMQDTLALLDAVLANMEDGVLLTDAARRIVFANRALAELTEISADLAIGMSRDEFVGVLAGHCRDKTEFMRKMGVDPSGPFAAREDFEVLRPRRRVLLWIAKPVAFANGVGQLETFADITAEADLFAERERLSLSDPLTGMLNRRGGEEAIAREVARARRSKGPLSFVLFDIDGLKGVNEAHGHAAGDEVLRLVSRILDGAFRGTDFAVRYGGEEFLAVLPGAALQGALLLADRVRTAVQEGTRNAGPRVTVSAGAAELLGEEDAAAVIARASANLREVKSAGRNRVN